MPMKWRRRSKRSYKTSSTSSSSSSSSSISDSEATPPPSLSRVSSHQPQPKRPQQRQAPRNLNLKRRTKRPYKIVMSSSSADPDEASDSPLSTRSSHQINSKSEGDQEQPVPDYTCSTSHKIIKSDPEADHDQPVSEFEYDTDVCTYDPELELRERSRRSGDNKPVLRWEIMSREYHRWFHQMKVHSPELEIENREMLEPSGDVILPLLRYQKEWLRWGMDQEASEMKGGILADEMGMGKTIQAISLVLTARELYAKSEASSSSSKGNNKCTLVICPLAAMLQWQREIEMHTANGCVKILVFHGKNRMRGELDFSQYDFVITTYETVEGDYRKYVMPPKEVCEYCGRRFAKVKRLSKHQRYL